MIEQGLYFAIGALCSTFLALLFFPVIWRRALRLSYARLQQVLPASLEDIIADQDRIRAKHAVEIAKLVQMNEQFTKTVIDTKIENSNLREDIIKKEQDLSLALEKMNAQEEDYRRMCDFVDTQSKTMAAILQFLVFVPFHKLSQSHHPVMIEGRSFFYQCLCKLMKFALSGSPNKIFLPAWMEIIKMGYGASSPKPQAQESKDRAASQ